MSNAAMLQPTTPLETPVVDGVHGAGELLRANFTELVAAHVRTIQQVGALAVQKVIGAVDRWAACDTSATIRNDGMLDQAYYVAAEHGATTRSKEFRASVPEAKISIAPVLTIRHERDRRAPLSTGGRHVLRRPPSRRQQSPRDLYARHAA